MEDESEDVAVCDDLLGFEEVVFGEDYGFCVFGGEFWVGGCYDSGDILDCCFDVGVAVADGHADVAFVPANLK